MTKLEELKMNMDETAFLLRFIDSAYQNNTLIYYNAKLEAARSTVAYYEELMDGDE